MNYGFSKLAMGQRVDGATPDVVMSAYKYHRKNPSWYFNWRRAPGGWEVWRTAREGHLRTTK